MTAPTGRPKGRPIAPASQMEQEAVERVAIGQLLAAKDPAEREALEYLKRAGMRTAQLIASGRYSEAFDQASAIVRNADQLIAYDDRENAQHAAIAAPLQMAMQAGA